MNDEEQDRMIKALEVRVSVIQNQLDELENRSWLMSRSWMKRAAAVMGYAISLYIIIGLLWGLISIIITVFSSFLSPY